MLQYIEGNCQYEECTERATMIASGRREYEEKPKPGRHDVGFYCTSHARQVADEGHPEYNDQCPNCGCLFGVN